MRINNIRKTLYLLARILGDVNAAKKGKVGKRVGRKVVGRGSGSIMRKLFK